MKTTELITLESLTCGNCDCLFALPVERHRLLQSTGEWFYCPNGHHIHYDDTEITRLRRELTAAKCETLAERQKREAVEIEMAKHQRRTKHGVCPCCRRTFVRLANHIAKAHPDYGPEQNRKLP